MTASAAAAPSTTEQSGIEAATLRETNSQLSNQVTDLNTKLQQKNNEAAQLSNQVTDLTSKLDQMKIELDQSSKRNVRIHSIISQPSEYFDSLNYQPIWR